MCARLLQRNAGLGKVDSEGVAGAGRKRNQASVSGGLTLTSASSMTTTGKPSRTG